MTERDSYPNNPINFEQIPAWRKWPGPHEPGESRS